MKSFISLSRGWKGINTTLKGGNKSDIGMGGSRSKGGKWI